MREFIKPAPVQLRVEGADGQHSTVQYSFASYVGEYVWCYAKWSEDGWDDAQIRIGDAIDAADVGGAVTLELDDWEKLREANKDASIKGPYAHVLRRHQKAIKSAHRPQLKVAE
jgi:hypothetical protein